MSIGTATSSLVSQFLLTAAKIATALGYTPANKAGDTFTGQILAQAQTATDVPLAVQGVVSQSGDLTQWKNSAGTNITRILSDGSIAGNNDAGGAIVLKEFGGNRIFRGVRTAGWTDGVTSTFFQVGESTNRNVVFQAAVANNIDRLQFNVIDGLQVAGMGFNTTPVPVALFEVLNNVATKRAATFKGAASQSANLTEWQDSAAAVHGTISENGYWTTRKNAAPADAELVAGELALWFTSTNGAASLNIKAKQNDGTVVTGSVALT